MGGGGVARVRDSLTSMGAVASQTEKVHLPIEAVLLPCRQCGLQVTYSDSFIVCYDEGGGGCESGSASSQHVSGHHPDREVHLPSEAVLLLPCRQRGLQVTYSDSFIVCGGWGQ